MRAPEHSLTVDAAKPLTYQPLMAKPSAPPEEPIGLLVAAVRSGLRQLLMARIAPLGLSVQQFWLLVGIAEHPCHSQAELAARLRVDEATACRVVRTLASHRWVRASRDGADRRRVRLELTAAGEKLAGALLPVAAEIRSAVESALTGAERAATRAGLVKILSAVHARAPRSDAAIAPGSRAPAGGRARARHAVTTATRNAP